MLNFFYSSSLIIWFGYGAPQQNPPGPGNLFTETFTCHSPSVQFTRHKALSAQVHSHSYTTLLTLACIGTKLELNVVITNQFCLHHSYSTQGWANNCCKLVSSPQITKETDPLNSWSQKGPQPPVTPVGSKTAYVIGGF